MIAVELKEDQITSMLDRLSASLTDMTPLMQEVGEVMVNSTKQNFVEGSDPDGVPWAPKSQTTIDRYLANKDGNLTQPLIGPSRRLSNEISYDADAVGVEWGSNLIQAAVQQFGAAKGAFGTAANGSSIPWGNIPARPFLGLGDEDRRMIVETIEDWLAESAG